MGIAYLVLVQAPNRHACIGSPCLIGIEACASSYHLVARAALGLKGHGCTDRQSATPSISLGSDALANFKLFHKALAMTMPVEHAKGKGYIPSTNDFNDELAVAMA